MNVAIFALTICSFAIGSTEFIPVGIIPIIQNYFGVSLSAAGLLVSVYAIGVAVGAPVLTVLTGGMGRKKLLILLMLLFIIGNLFSCFAFNFYGLILARFITALAHGVFFSVGSTIATNLVPKEKEASAIALMFAGLTAALILGVPAGTWIGAHFDWRVIFLLVAVLGFIGVIGICTLIPSNLPQPHKTTILEQISVITNHKLIIVYLITIVGYGGNFAVFTYLSPLLTDIAKFTPQSVGIIILLYGVSVAFGNIYGGKLADKLGAVKTLYIVFFGLALVLFSLNFVLYNKTLTIIAVLIWGAFAFGNVPPLQVYIVQLAKRYSPKLVDVASGLNISAFNIGIALGTSIGGHVIVSYGLHATPSTGASILLLAVVLTWVSYKVNHHKG